MNMNENEELRNRISNSVSPDAIELPEYLVAQAAKSKTKRLISFNQLRVGLGSLAFGSLALVGAFVLPNAMAPQPLFTMGAAAQGGQTMASAESAPADAKIGMIWPGYVQYNHIADGLSDETGKGHVYQAQLVGTADDLLAKLMREFKIDGEIKKDEWSTELAPNYTVQTKSDAGVESYLNVYWAGTGAWYFSSWDSSKWACTTTPSEGTKEQDSAQVCEQPQPQPELIPSEQEMADYAAKLFSRLGTKLNASDFKVYRDSWGGSATADLTLEGEPLPLSVSVGWDAWGNLANASGHSFTLVDRGEFKTVSATDAVSRIKEGRWYGSAPSSFYNNGATFRTMVDPAVTSDVAVEPAPGETAATEEAPTPQVVDLKINKSQTAMLGVWDAAGGFWLVPGHLLYNDQGWFDSIISLEEGVIELPKYEEVMPMIEPGATTKDG
ncbi:MAG: hypothetical protein RL752_565 [Actinomycetota bacterium]